MRVQGEEREQNGGTHENTHRRKTVQVRPVQLRSQAERQPRPAQGRPSSEI